MHELVERDIPLARLHALRREAAAGHGRVALLAGEAGIGKTSLLQQLLRQPDGQAAGPVWWGGCDALQTPLPLAPLLDVARDAQPSLGPLLDGPRSALFDAVLAALRAAPTLFVVEDAHWADEATLDLLKFLGRRIAGTPALLVISYRSDELGSTHPLRRLLGELPQAERIELAPLTPAGVALLARRALRDPAALHATTQGNPFFVTELLRHGSAELPRSVQDLVLARFARLGAEARQLLGAAALVPGRIERWLLAAVVPDLTPLQEAQEAGLLRAEGPEALAFRHELARVAIEATLAEPQALHARLLRALSARGGIAPARLAHHALGAGDAAEIRRHAPPAAEAALARGSLREAARHYRAALAHAEPATLPRWQEAFADCAQRIDAIDEAIGARERLDALLGDGDDDDTRALNLSRLAMLYVHMSRNDEADAASRRAIALVQQGPESPATAAVYGTEAALRMLNRDCEAAVDWARRSLALAAGDRLRQLASMSTLGTALMFLDYDAGCRQMLEVLDLALAEGHAPIAAQALMNLGSAAGEMMRYADGMAWLRRGADFAAERELDAAAHYAQAWLALCCLQAGLWDEAGRRAASVVERPATSAISRLMALLALARLRMRRGDPGVDEALHAATALAAGTLQRIAPLRAARAEAAWSRGDMAGCAAEAQAALPLAQAHRHPVFIGELAFWSWRAGELAEPPPGCAEPFALQIAGRWREAAAAWEALACPYQQGQALADGDLPAQQQALALFEQLGARPAAEALRRRLREQHGIHGPRRATRERPFGLTGRELQVLQLLCRGLRNAEIARQLSRSVRTVDHHLAAIFAKLGVDSRTAAVQAAGAAGLAPKDGQSAAAN